MINKTKVITVDNVEYYVAYSYYKSVPESLTLDSVDGQQLELYDGILLDTIELEIAEDLLDELREGN